MSDKPNDGGPAFPGVKRVTLIRAAGGGHNDVPRRGMTLRDYFAAQAMAAIITSMPNYRGRQPKEFNELNDGQKANAIARTAYDYANGMILVRGDSHA